MEITFVKGDATQPQATGPRAIVHVCNDIGGWGRGFVLAISKRWKEPEAAYREWFKSKENFALGKVQWVQVEADLWVINMIGQRDIHPIDGVPPIRYDALATCLGKVAQEATQRGASIHMPRIGCGLAGGQWDQVEAIINKTLLAHGVATYVYDFN
ncbi:MAG: macro domain-containing protein [Acidobacteria bacterium]|nr:macro domain-containing protein [Acidobacteriota bacterium]MCB9399142.1 macro domain-containing protein [Acidobacteriota bacterium]